MFERAAIPHPVARALCGSRAAARLPPQVDVHFLQESQDGLHGSPPGTELFTLVLFPFAPDFI